MQEKSGKRINEMNKGKKRFVTLFPRCGNVGLVKDVGMIPYILYKYYDYDSSLVCLKQPEEYTYAENEVKGLKIVFLHKVFNSQLLGILRFFMKEGKEIDFLNLYHLSISRSLLYACIYKMINKSGKTYLKLDLDFNGTKHIEKLGCIKRFLVNYLIKNIDLISAESSVICQRVSRALKQEIICIPNGYHEFEIEERYNANVQKENIILTVGRLGTEQKNTESLLQAYLELKLQNWKLFLVGSYTDEFKKKIEEVYKKNPLLKEYIILTGDLNNRKELEKIYRKAKLFVLPSRWESFGIVLVEALRYGCRVITTDQVPSAFDLIKEDNGEIIEEGNIEKLENAILKWTNELEKEELFNLESGEQYSWVNICGKLDNELKQLG